MKCAADNCYLPFKLVLDPLVVGESEKKDMFEIVTCDVMVNEIMQVNCYCMVVRNTEPMENCGCGWMTRQICLDLQDCIQGFILCNAWSSADAIIG